VEDLTRQLEELRNGKLSCNYPPQVNKLPKLYLYRQIKNLFVINFTLYCFLDKIRNVWHGYKGAFRKILPVLQGFLSEDAVVVC
jgi:hypothetical protein